MNSDHVAPRVLPSTNSDSPGTGHSRKRVALTGVSIILLLAATAARAAAPDITPIANQFTREAPVSPLQIGLSATDPDGDGIDFSFTATPVFAEGFCSITVDDGLGSGTLSCNPQPGNGGNYTIRVTATDDSLALESASVQFVLDVNSIPSIDPVGAQLVVESASIEIPLRASDDDPGDGLAFSFSATPAAAEGFCSITRDNGNGSGALTCSPEVGNANAYTVTVTATDDATAPASASSAFTLNVAANQVPTATGVAIQGSAVLGATLNGTYTYGDAEGDTQGTSTFQWYRNDLVIAGATGSSYTVVVADVETTLTFGVTPVALTGASPGTEARSNGVAVANSAPVLVDITDKSVVEGSTINVALSASDPDGDGLAFSHSLLPTPPSGDFCAVTADNGAGTGTLTCSPAVGNDGPYTVTVTVTDDGVSPKSTSDTFVLTVGPNQPPTATSVLITGNATLGAVLTGNYIYVDAEDDPEGTSTFKWYRGGIEIPGAVGTTYTVVSADVGTNLRFEVTPVAAAGAATGTPVQSADFPIANQSPVVDPIPSQSVVEAGSLDIALSATDPEGDGLSFSFTSIPTRAETFCAITADNGNGTGTLRCSPVVGDAALGPYTLTVTVTDDANNPASGSATFTLTVNANQPPTASGVTISGEPTFGKTLTGVYIYADPEDDPEGTSSFRWLRDGTEIPGATSISYTVAAADVETSLTFEVTPVAAGGALEGTPVASAPLLVSNTVPSITGQNVVEIVEDGSREIVLTDLIVSDLDSDFPGDFTLRVQDGQNYSRGGTNGNTVLPVLNFNGELAVPVTVNDGFDDSAVFTMRVVVTPVNDAPVIDGLVAPLSTPEDQSITIRLADLDVSDVDTDDIYPTGFSLQLQPGANYTVSGTIVTPAENFNGQITVPATVADPDGLASQAFPILIPVTAVNDTPALDMPIEDQTAIENSPFSLNVSGNFSDADGDTLTYSATGLPASNNITINAVTGVISGTPRIEDARDNAPYIVTVTASDGEAPTIGTFDLTISALDRANLALRIGVSPDTGMPSDELRWTFTALNPLGPQAGSDVQLTGSFVGTGLTVAAESGANCTIDAVDNVVTDFVCIIGTLPVGASTPTVMTTTTSQATEVVAFATVAGADNLPIDPNEEDNSDLAAAGVAEAFSVGAVQILGSTSIRSVAAGDVNVGGDGAIDIVVGTAAGQPVQIYLSDAPRESCGCLRDFLPSPISIPENGANEGVALADFNRDGSLDLVVVNGGGQPDRVFVNDGDGNFSPIATLEPSFGAAVAVADFNLDGNPDIAVAEIGERNRVYFGDGFGGFPGGSIRLGSAGSDEANSNDVAAADFNGDGRPDLVFANVGGDSRLWLSQPGGGFTSGGRLPVGDAVAVAAGDLNGDGRADIVFGRVPSGVGDVPSNPVLLNNGSGGFGAPAQLLGISPTNDVHIGDVNNDGSPDIVFINGSGVHQVWSATGSGYVLQREQIIDLDAREGVLAHLGFTDTDAPGGLDLAMGGSTGGGVAVYLNDAAGNLGRGDVEAPVITLNGNASVSIESGLAYSDAGATAADNIDGDISRDIRVTNTVNTAVVGSYTVSYDVADFAGNSATTVTRTVNVTPAAGSGGGGGGAMSFWMALALLGVLASAIVGQPGVRAERIRAATRK